MALVRKTILVPGQYVSPDGPVEITRERIQRFADTHARLSAAGVKFPVPWAHDSHADPLDPVRNPTAIRQFHKSRYNAGYYPKLDVGPEGELIATIDAPGLAVENGNLVSVVQVNGAPVKTAIGEVSVGIDDWVDGKGRRHNDIIKHIALTPLPVVAGQSGFKGLATGDGKPPKLSLSLTRMATMATDDPAEQAEEVESAVTDAAATDGVGDTDVPEDSDVLQPVADEAEERTQRICALLSSMGCPLPPDTTSENVVERLEVALGVLAQKVANDAAVEATTAEDETETQPTEEPPPTGGGVMMDTNRHSNPTMLSTLRAIKADPVREAWYEERLTERAKTRRERVEALKRRGLPVAQADKLIVGPVRLSTIIDAKSGKLTEGTVDRILTALEASLPAEEWAAHYLSTVAGDAVKAADSPVAGSDPNEIVEIKSSGGSMRMAKHEALRHGLIKA